MPLTVADTVFVPVAVEDNVPVATPLMSVVVAGCVSVFPLPVAVSTTAPPCSGLPAASRAVTVTVAVPFIPTLGGETVTVDWVGDTTDVRLA